MLYLVNAVLGACCARCMLYLVYAVYGLSCTQCLLRIREWRDSEGGLNFVFCDDGREREMGDQDGNQDGGYDRI